MKTQTVFRLFLLCGISSAISARTADWPTFGHDPQRTGWAFEETILNRENVAGLALRWKVHLKNEPKSLLSLTAPVVASNVLTAHG
ncbi:MAG: hypothetical protein WB607_08545, partial [Candidatus Acidiferrum sp.]